MAFIEDRLLECVAYGFTFGPERSTRVHRLRSGHETRNANWVLSKWRGSAPYQNIRPEDYGSLLGAFEEADAMTHAFRFKNYLDYSATAEPLGVAPSGTTAVQLVKAYQSFGGSFVQRTVKKPVAGTVTVYQSGTPKAGTIDTTTGLFTPTTSWSAGQALTADFEFDYGVRFDQDWLPFSYDNWQALNGEIAICEVYL